MAVVWTACNPETEKWHKNQQPRGQDLPQDEQVNASLLGDPVRVALPQERTEVIPDTIVTEIFFFAFSFYKWYERTKCSHTSFRISNLLKVIH